MENKEHEFPLRSSMGRKEYFRQLFQLLFISLSLVVMTVLSTFRAPGLALSHPPPLTLVALVFGFTVAYLSIRFCLRIPYAAIRITPEDIQVEEKGQIV